ncbi:BBE domain-containing protein [Kitasatospora sp. NPDC052896]|uniref:BBE domain-containing protein n=1 Tax=Kitasatospora sp. NPDC052896 TaxID=3364061 RepID=UPI0037CCC02E
MTSRPIGHDGPKCPGPRGSCLGETGSSAARSARPARRGRCGGGRPDADLADPARNTSGVPWHPLSYQDDYPRLREVRTRWDPRDAFRHAPAVEPLS